VLPLPQSFPRVLKPTARESAVTASMARCLLGPMRGCDSGQGTRDTQVAAQKQRLHCNPRRRGDGHARPGNGRSPMPHASSPLPRGWLRPVRAQQLPQRATGSRAAGTGSHRRPRTQKPSLRARGAPPSHPLRARHRQGPARARTRRGTQSLLLSAGPRASVALAGVPGGGVARLPAQPRQGFSKQFALNCRRPFPGPSSSPCGSCGKFNRKPVFLFCSTNLVSNCKGGVARRQRAEKGAK
jgi:hypothetical protein